MDKWIIRKEKLPEDYDIAALTSVNVQFTAPISTNTTETINCSKRKRETNPSYIKIRKYSSDFRLFEIWICFYIDR